MLRFIASVAVVMLAGLSGASAWPDQPISEYQSSGDDTLLALRNLPR
jgi:hypothetical protein